MIGLFNALPMYCPMCATKLTWLQFTRQDWQAFCSFECRCGFRYQKATDEAIKDAATRSGGDLVALEREEQ